MNLGLDLDGTLIDCERRHCELMAASARALGHTLDRRAFWSHKRQGAANLGALRSCGFGDDAAADMNSLWIHDVERLPWLLLDRPVEGTEQALIRLRARGMRLHVFTARRARSMVRLQIERLGWRDLFDEIVVVSPHDAAAQKAEALRRANCEHFIGDTESDAAAAKVAGITFTALSSGMRCAEYLTRHAVSDVAPSLAAWSETVPGHIS